MRHKRGSILCAGNKSAIVSKKIMKSRQSGHMPSGGQVPPVYYALFVNLSERKAVVIGGGKVAERKIFPLLKAGARVTVISPQITKRIERAKQQNRVNHIARPYRRGDLKDAFLVIAATDSPAVNERISRDAPCLVNVVDTPRLCNFIVPSTMARGPLNIAVSTSGISPALSRSIRKELEDIYGCEFAQYLTSLRKIRQNAMEVIHDGRKRTKFLKSIASQEMISTLRRKGVAQLRKTARDLLKRAGAS